MEKIDTALGVAIVAIVLAVLQSDPPARSPGVVTPPALASQAPAAKSEHELVLASLLRLHLPETGSGRRAPPSYLKGLQLRKGPDGYLLLLPQAAATTEHAEFKRFIRGFWRAYQEAPIPTVHAIYLGDAGAGSQQVRAYRVVRVADIHAGFRDGMSFDVLVERLHAGIETLGAEELRGSHAGMRSFPGPGQPEDATAKQRWEAASSV